MNQHAAPPEFAMSFTQEAVRLECRDGPEWQPLGQARFAGGDLASVLNALRKEAGGRAGELDTLLVIPDDQILYTVLTVPFGSDTAATIARALEAASPYRAEELAFDWCPAANGDIETLRVAAVARRTLDEAEEFARAQGFRPSGFQARPGDERFDGQPDFGPTRLAQEQFNRRPFSAPDLTQARVTAPVIEGDGPPRTAMPTVSRIVPHVVLAAPVADVSAPAPGSEAARAAAVIRHGQGAPLTAQRLSPRAEAVHARAATARARREAAPDPDMAPSRAMMARLRGIDPGRLPVMVGGLALLLVLALLFLGRPTGEMPVAEAPAPAPVAEPVPVQVTEVPAETPALPQTTLPPVVPGEVPGTAAVEDLATPEAAAPEDVAADPLPAMDAPVDSAAADSATPDPAIAEAPVTGDAPPAVAPPAGVADDLTRPARQPDALDRALAEALAPQGAATLPEGAATAATVTAGLATGTPPVRPAAAPAAAPVQAAAPPAARVSGSVRPPRATPAAASAPAAPDSRPNVPDSPLPYAAQSQTPAAPVEATRPRSRPEAVPQAASPASAPAPAPAPTTATTPASSVPASRPPAPTGTAPQAAPTSAATAPSAAPGAARPPSRPESLSLLEEGSAAEPDQPRRLTAGERALVTRQLRDLRTAQAGAAPLTEAERGLVFQLADARPARRPVAIGAPSQRAAQEAASPRPVSPRPAARASIAAGVISPAPEAAPAAVASATPSGAIQRSARPASRPGNRAVARGVSGEAVEQAIASAIEASPATPGAVPLTALSSSPTPPRRSAGAASNAMLATAAPVAAALTPSSPDLRAAAEAQAAEAAMAAQRRQDDELQAQAEARARSQAAADARADAQARAAAEARARAQAEAEARTAAARNQRYQPPEVDAEPDVVAAVPRNAIGNAAATATVTDGIQLNSTQIIGTIGAGQASRALVRLSNGRVLTLRIGDKINGGTITAIGDSRITYQKQGRAHALGVLNGQ